RIRRCWAAASGSSKASISRRQSQASTISSACRCASSAAMARPRGLYSAGLAQPRDSASGPLLPEPEGVEKPSLRVSGDILLPERADEQDGLAHLVEVVIAVRADAEMALEACLVRRGQRSLHIVRDQLDELLATQTRCIRIRHRWTAFPRECMTLPTRRL